MLPGDHRCGLSQRQRQEPQLGGHRGGSRGIGQACPPGQERQRLFLGEHVYRDDGPQVRHRWPVSGDQHLGRAAGRNKRPQHIGVCRVIEHEQAAVPVCLQPVPYRPPGSLASRPVPPSDSPAASATAARPASRFPVSRGTDPGHQPPALRHPSPRIRRRQLRLAHTRHPEDRTHPGIDPLQLRQQIGPRLETRRLSRDIAHHERLAGTGRSLVDHGRAARSGMGVRPACISCCVSTWWLDTARNLVTGIATTVISTTYPHMPEY